jgi:TDG/mug DNA glycosylase family protein
VPTKAELQAAYGRTIPDLVGPDLRVLLVGINPSLWSGWSGRHFGRPSNRLWLTLHEAGFTARRLLPEETGDLLAAGIGITNLVNRATARADKLTDGEILPACRGWSSWPPSGGRGPSRSSASPPTGPPSAARVGRQDETLDGIPLWVLPNPSGPERVVYYYRVHQLADALRELLLSTPAGGRSTPTARTSCRSAKLYVVSG